MFHLNMQFDLVSQGTNKELAFRRLCDTIKDRLPELINDDVIAVEEFNPNQPQPNE